MTVANNGSNNATFLAAIGDEAKAVILEGIANHYDISPQQAYEEVSNEYAEHLLAYMVEPHRTFASALMMKMKLCGLRGF